MRPGQIKATLSVPLALLVGSILYAAYWLAQDPCEDVRVAEIASPNGRLSAVTFSRSCGATTGFSTKVAIFSKGNSSDLLGTALIVDTDHGKAPAGAGGGPEVKVAWGNDEMLTLRYDLAVRAWKTATSVSNVAVTHAREPMPAQVASGTAK